MKLKNKKILIAIIILIIIAATIIIHSINISNRYNNKIDLFSEISFITPTQAIIFWKSDNETIGYIKYGSNSNNLDKISYQTSSEKGLTHAVIIDNIPLEGIYYQIYEENMDILIKPSIKEIKFR